MTLWVTIVQPKEERTEDKELPYHVPVEKVIVLVHSQCDTVASYSSFGALGKELRKIHAACTNDPR
eukprot:CAMPEP_0174385264 /NCGR_PEP_ID=MMETSP0811_2-20130205/126479_1 /TAXON_ID=73025 ORGANISM="Eutreptiella gymnastica-like, Strain CCMP1594" /NCGR_SAMPLE_ID=MMETSP0811_2 /ASSEMBLY_ACC=CAM_ASM_000667 /LENGTH=65 /DNA_ID=CAMNT_0015539515 /DNA_START=1034 /DNA_END=1228 /DNA_ORIENTATION=+